MSSKTGRRNVIGRTTKNSNRNNETNANPDNLRARYGKTKISESRWFMIKTQQPQQAKQAQPQTPQQQPQYFRKRIGSTNYKVAVYSSTTSKESIEDKILRLAKNDIADITKMATSKKVVGL
jgi:hypothetical protein